MMQKIIYSLTYSILFFFFFYVLFFLNNIWHALLIFVIFALSLLPFYFEKKTSITIPSFFKSSFLLFLFSSFFLGEIWGFYEKFFWWDIALHLIAGIGLGLVGFIIIRALTLKDNILPKSRSYIEFIFSLSFAVSIGVLWEFTEFFVDVFLGLNMQKPYPDTMIDLLVDTAGATMGAHAGFLYSQKKKHFFLPHILKEFFHENMKDTKTIQKVKKIKNKIKKTVYKK